jgi:hypothetical protein
MKIILITIIGGLVVVLVVMGLVTWMSMPRYIILEKEKSLSINSNDRDFVITPGKVRIINIWDKKNVTIPLTIINGEGDTTFKINTGFPFQAYDDYANAEDLKELSFKLDNNLVTLSSNSTKTVNIEVSKNIKGKLQRQEEWISIEQMPTDNYATIKILRTYILKIYVN